LAPDGLPECLDDSLGVLASIFGVRIEPPQVLVREAQFHGSILSVGAAGVNHHITEVVNFLLTLPDRSSIIWA